MKLFGAYLRELRIAKDLPLRKVAAFLDIDTSLRSKIERGEKCIDRGLLKAISDFFSADEQYLLSLYLSESVAEVIYQEDNIEELLEMSREVCVQLKNIKTEQSTISFKNE